MGSHPNTSLLGVHDPISVLKNHMSTCHCLLLAFGKYSNSAWGVMACLGTLAPGQVFLESIVYADYVTLALWVSKTIFFECPHLQSIRDRFPGLF